MAHGQPGFNTTIPALVVKLDVGKASDLGVTHTGSKLIHFETPTGTLETIPGFEPAFKSKVHFGADWLHFDPDGEHARIDLKVVAETEEGKSISFGYTGVITLNEGLRKIFNLDPDMKTVPFGNAIGNYTFITSDPKLKYLENNMWSSSSRLVVGEKGLQVESRIAKVVCEEAY